MLANRRLECNLLFSFTKNTLRTFCHTFSTVLSFYVGTGARGQPLGELTHSHTARPQISSVSSDTRLGVGFKNSIRLQLLVGAHRIIITNGTHRTAWQRNALAGQQQYSSSVIYTAVVNT